VQDAPLKSNGEKKRAQTTTGKKTKKWSGTKDARKTGTGPKDKNVFSRFQTADQPDGRKIGVSRAAT